jgi:catalase
MLTPEQAVDRINEGFGRPRGDRTLHAKGRFYAATFTATPEAAKLCRARHLNGDAVPALVRLSNGGGLRLPDRVADVRGLAVSIRPDGGDAWDILAQTAPRFPVRTPDDFVAMTYALSVLPRRPWLIATFVATHPAAARALAANGRAGAIKAPHSFAGKTYYAIHAYRWLDADGGSRWVRYTLRPEPAATDAGKPDRKDFDFLHHELEQRLNDGPARFTLQVQIAEAGDDPHDPTSVWRSTRRVDAGTLEITAPDPEPESDGGLVVFDPVRVVDGMELSDDPILRFRPLAYSVSAGRRAPA